MANLKALINQNLYIEQKYIREIDDQLKLLPIGTLYRINQSGSQYYFQNIYKKGQRNRIYLGTQTGKHCETISALKRKRFLLRCKKVLEGNVVALRACLLKYEEFDPVEISSRMAASYKNITDVPNLHHDEETDQDFKRAEWMRAPYPKAEMHPESLKHEAIGGLKVRSKSEALIAFALDLAHVAFHYEEMLELGDKKIAPDFTILHPATGEKVYWEHFGMMDDPAYASETYKKLVLYGQNGIVPGMNLIFTMETNEEPLSIREIQRIIACHFA